MGDDTSQGARLVDDDAISARGATGVDTTRLDGELVVGSRDGEVEALVVVVLVRVGRAAGGTTVGYVVARSLSSGIDLGGRVVDGAAGCGGAADELGGRGAGDGNEGEEEGGELHLGGAVEQRGDDGKDSAERGQG